MEAVAPRRWLAALAVVAWAGVVVTALYAFYRHEVTAGARGPERAQWPAASTLPRTADLPNLIMFIHPSCPCSRASVAELTSLLVSTRARAAVLVVFVADEEGGSLWDAVGRIGGARRIVDRDGIEATRFGARTSGHVAVYDARGGLVYAGGITGSRGHVGDNMGKRSVARVLADLSPVDTRYGVYGCGLLGGGAPQ